MTQQIINVGAAANSGSGDPLRTAMQKVNSNFTEVYTGVATPVFTPTTPGSVPASGGGTTNFLRADGTWAAAGGTLPNGLNIVWPAIDSSASAGPWGGYTITTRISGTALLQANASSFQIGFGVASGNCDVNKAFFKRTLVGSTTVTDTQQITWSGVTNPTLAVGTTYCDKLVYTVDPQHDYCVQIYLTTPSTNNNTVSLWFWAGFGASPQLNGMNPMTSGFASGDFTGTAPSTGLGAGSFFINQMITKA